MANKTPAQTPPASIEERITQKQEQLLSMKHQLHEQLIGVENQLYLINQLLHPESAPTPEQAPAPPGTI